MKKLLKDSANAKLFSTKMATNDEYVDIFHNLLNKDELIEKFGWEEYFVFALMLGVSIFF